MEWKEAQTAFRTNLLCIRQICMGRKIRWICLLKIRPTTMELRTRWIWKGRKIRWTSMAFKIRAITMASKASRTCMDPKANICKGLKTKGILTNLFKPNQIMEINHIHRWVHSQATISSNHSLITHQIWEDLNRRGRNKKGLWSPFKNWFWRLRNTI